MGTTETSVAEDLRRAHAAVLADLRKLEDAACAAPEGGTGE
jgi:hypothetical protein